MMLPHPRRLLGTVAVLVLLAACAYLAWKVPGDQPAAAPDPEAPGAEELERDRKLVLACNAERQRITDDVIARRLTLREAAACFLAVNERLSGWLRPKTEPYPGRSPEERACRQVIAYVDSTLQNRAGHGELMSDLRAQLQEYLAEQSKMPPQGEPGSQEGKSGP
jgi:hypothetical protein